MLIIGTAIIYLTQVVPDLIVSRRLEVELEHSSFASFSLEAILERVYEYLGSRRQSIWPTGKTLNA
jgi:hypothetical protein